MVARGVFYSCLGHREGAYNPCPKVGCHASLQQLRLNGKALGAAVATLPQQLTRPEVRVIRGVGRNRQRHFVG